MGALILGEFRSVFPFVSLLWGLIVCFSAVAATGDFVLLVPLAAIFGGSIRARRTAWYLALPWSRLKVLGVVMAQNTLFGVTGIFVALATHLFLRSLGIQVESLGDELSLLLIVTGAGIGLSSLSVFLKAPKTFVVVGDRAFFRNARVLLVSLVAIYLGLRFDLFFEPAVLATMIFAIPFFMVLSVFGELRFPIESMRRLRKTAVLTFVALTLGSPLTAAIVAHTGDPNSGRTHLAVQFLRRIPVFLSKERAWALFLSGRAERGSNFRPHLEFLRASVEPEAWTQRTLQCRSQFCLDLSSEVWPPDGTPSSELEARFMTLMGPCGLQREPSGDVRCKGPRLSKSHLNSWLKRLEAEGLLERWLEGGEGVKRVIAMKGLVPRMDRTRLTRLRDLMADPDPIVAETARHMTSIGEAQLANPRLCDDEKNSSALTCRIQSEGVQILI